MSSRGRRMRSSAERITAPRGAPVTASHHGEIWPDTHEIHRCLPGVHKTAEAVLGAMWRGDRLAAPCRQAPISGSLVESPLPCRDHALRMGLSLDRLPQIAAGDEQQERGKRSHN